ncbi:hypothetical protein AAXB25_22700 [Paenibacillus lautus]|uniref:hypothetical protein n=1 Tax=Paenibacillus lautus TaxID=1401 RepID=UPI003D2E94FD
MTEKVFCTYCGRESEAMIREIGAHEIPEDCESCEAEVLCYEFEEELDELRNK